MNIQWKESPQTSPQPALRELQQNLNMTARVLKLAVPETLSLRYCALCDCLVRTVSVPEGWVTPATPKRPPSHTPSPSPAADTPLTSAEVAPQANGSNLCQRRTALHLFTYADTTAPVSLIGSLVPAGQINIYSRLVPMVGPMQRAWGAGWDAGHSSSTSAVHSVVECWDRMGLPGFRFGGGGVDRALRPDPLPKRGSIDGTPKIPQKPTPGVRGSNGSGSVFKDTRPPVNSATCM